MLCSHPHSPLFYYSLPLLGGEKCPFLALFTHPGFFLSPCSLPLWEGKSHLTDGKELGMSVSFIFPSCMGSTSYRKSTFSVLFHTLSCAVAAWCVCVCVCGSVCVVGGGFLFHVVYPWVGKSSQLGDVPLAGPLDSQLVLSSGRALAKWRWHFDLFESWVTVSFGFKFVWLPPHMFKDAYNVNDG